ncbi:hypothetical protein GLOTRDRAFT_139552 [Gloeophyllum trabeum ATCC 11539]|uniref:Uncharacterized protein n=1 Tax=Gloeophyllum trabeum (strain ATCC 11539 / FP-39264 / Madison 617) TaxID=670483 RepID=S7Q2G7_GLOTA|nr:uncharacterized protein GLOTRDRAFT_139552 [Gloeophyllum trabeum ATCC 11539]EPQ54196.1 hypothetical protein GLOTRDRAFT_139552 [Gloeophyllum trabeum ATCC 11539]
MAYNYKSRTDAPPFLRFPTADSPSSHEHFLSPSSEHRVRAHTLATSSTPRRPPLLSIGSFQYLPLAPYQMSPDRFSPPASDLLPDDPFASLSPGPELVTFASANQSLVSLVSPSMSTTTLQPLSRSRSPTPTLSRCSSREDAPAPRTPQSVMPQTRSSLSTSESGDSGDYPNAVRRLPELLKSAPSTTSLRSFGKMSKGNILRKKLKKVDPPPLPWNASVYSDGSDEKADLRSLQSRTASHAAQRRPWYNRVLSRSNAPDKAHTNISARHEVAPAVQLRPISRFDVDFDLELDLKTSRMLA